MKPSLPQHLCSLPRRVRKNLPTPTFIPASFILPITPAAESAASEATTASLIASPSTSPLMTSPPSSRQRTAWSGFKPTDHEPHRVYRTAPLSSSRSEFGDMYPHQRCAIEEQLDKKTTQHGLSTLVDSSVLPDEQSRLQWSRYANQRRNLREELVELSKPTAAAAASSSASSSAAVVPSSLSSACRTSKPLPTASSSSASSSAAVVSSSLSSAPKPRSQLSSSAQLFLHHSPQPRSPVHRYFSR